MISTPEHLYLTKPAGLPCPIPVELALSAGTQNPGDILQTHGFERLYSDLWGLYLTDGVPHVLRFVLSLPPEQECLESPVVGMHTPCIVPAGFQL